MILNVFAEYMLIKIDNISLALGKLTK